MIRRVWWWGAAVLLYQCAVAQAQWQPLFGDGGLVQGSPSSAPPPASAMPSAQAPRSSGWMPLDTGAMPPAAAPVAPVASPAPTVPTAPTPGVAGGAGAATGGGLAGTGAGGGPAGPAGVEIRYSGQAAADPRTATMVLKISGNQATADVHINGVCEQNIHLGGADLKLTGTLAGPWEGKTSSIDGGWTGTDHFCGSDEPNEGQFKYFLKEGETLHLRINGKRGQYGWNFKPTGRVYTTTAPAGGAAVGGLGSGFDSPLGPPGPGYRRGANPPQFAMFTSADRLRELFTGGTIALQVGDSHFQMLPSSTVTRTVYDPSADRAGTTSDRCVNVGGKSVVMDPSSIAEVAEVGDGVKVTGRSKGKGELWIGGEARCTKSDGSEYKMRTIIIYIVLVGDEAVADYRRQQGRPDPLPPSPPGDIASAKVTGRAILKGSGEPVGNAIVSLGTKEGGSIRRDAWKTRDDGTFDVTAESLSSGRYEVVVQKLGYGPVPGKCEADPAEPPGVGVACDMWPVDKIYVTLSVDAPNANAGTVRLDFLRNFDYYRGGAKTSTQPPRDTRIYAPRQRFQ